MNEELLNILLFFSGVALGSWVTIRIFTRLHAEALHEIFKQLGITEDQLKNLKDRTELELERLRAGETPEDSEDSLTEYEITVEQHGSQLYAFIKDGEFIGQGPDRDALVARIAERFRNVKFRVAEGADLLK